MTKTYIIGHQKPDTDSVVATLAFKHLFDSMEYWGHSNSVASIADDINPETKYILNRFKIEKPGLIKSRDIEPDAKIVLVDHNEESQRLSGLNPNQITDIFDHHRLSLQLNQPIFATIKTWGATCTIAWYLMNQHQLEIPQSLAALMLSAIISDTVGFKSATTTEIDKQAVKDLQKKAEISDLDQLILDILKAKSDISGLTDKQIVKKDYKIYDFVKKTFISQLETVEQKKILSLKKTDLLKAMADVKKEEGIDLVYMVISDIFQVNSKILILSPAERTIAEKAFAGTVNEDVLDIGPKLSRKKQIAPAIEKALL